MLLRQKSVNFIANVGGFMLIYVMFLVNRSNLRLSMEKTYFLLHGPNKKLGDYLLGHLRSMQGSSYIVILSFDAEQMLTTQVSRTAFPDRPGNWKSTNFVSNIVSTKEENFFIGLNSFCFNFVSTFLVVSFM